jgi:hypothetical protein
MEAAMKLTLLMIVTPRDCGIALYSITALSNHLRQLPFCSLAIYENALSEFDRTEINRTTGGNPRIVCKSNNQEICEEAPEIWSRELILLDTPLVGILDPDFEIFDPSFIVEMIQAFSKDEKLAVYSTDWSPTRKVFETYTQVDALLMERWHTWFCIYRKVALEQFHDFSYVEAIDPSGLSIKYDHSAWLQQALKKRGWRGQELIGDHEWKYLHYGAFAQNKHLTGLLLARYRALKIFQHNGYRHLHGSALLSRPLRRIGSVCYRLLQQDYYDRQRERYVHDQD